MSDSIEDGPPRRQRNPLYWLAIAAMVAIAYIFSETDRGNTPVVSKPDNGELTSGPIDRSLLIPPGMRARQFIEQLRAEGQPYPLDEVFNKAADYDHEGSLADAHLLYFFAAREGHVDSMIKLGEMLDPNLFQSENSLLDQPDPLQSYKWYQKAAAQGDSDMSARIEKLQQWAMQESESDNPYARQLLMVLQ